MPNIIAAIIFDLDGVIIDSNPQIERFWKGWATQAGITLTQEQIFEWIYGRTAEDTIAGLFAQLSDEQKHQIKQEGKSLGNNMPAIPISGIQQFVMEISKQGLPIGLVTSSDQRRMYQMLDQLNISASFSHFVTEQDITKGKPDPEPYQKMAAKMGLDPVHCLVFEDAISGVQSAFTAGMQVTGIGNPYIAPRLLAHGAKMVIPHYEYLAIRQNQLWHQGEQLAEWT